MDQQSDCAVNAVCIDAGGSPDTGSPMMDGGPMGSRDVAMTRDAHDPADVGPIDAMGHCEPGQAVCLGDGSGRRVCDEDGRGERIEPCGMAEFCAQGQCQAQVCMPDSMVCDNDVARLCNESGSAFVEGADEDCAADGRSCEDGLCADAISASRGAVCESIACLAERSVALVCGRYIEDVLNTAQNPFIAGDERCDPGTLTEEGYAEALRVANYGRWLAGLPEAAYDEALNPPTQSCATIMANQRSLSHNPPPNWACYTEAGAQAAGESNIHLSSRNESVADSVIGYFEDGGDNNRADVGHRRWLQSHTLRQVGFGFHHSQTTGAASSCYNVIASPAVRPVGPPFVAYPNPGPFPIQWLTSRFWTLPWSVHIDAGYRDPWAATNEWTVSIWRVEGELETALSVQHVNASGTWYGRNHAVVFSPGFEVTPGTYRIVVEGPNHRFEWSTELVNCQ
jgi:hypothetical protein